MYLGIYYLLIKNRNVGWIYVILAIITHYSLTVVFFLVLLVKLGVNITSKELYGIRSFHLYYFHPSY